MLELLCSSYWQKYRVNLQYFRFPIFGPPQEKRSSNEGKMKRPRTAKSRVQILVNRPKICFGQCCNGRCFSPSTMAFNCQHHSTSSPSHFHFNVLLSERQAGRDWTTSKKCFLGHRETLDTKVIWWSLNLFPWQSSNKNAKIQLKHINPSMFIFSIRKAVFPVTVLRLVLSV
jgi:hypothetical protein